MDRGSNVTACWRFAVTFCVGVAAAGCASNHVIDEGRQMVIQGRYLDAIDHLEAALRADPQNRLVRNELLRQRDLFGGSLVQEALSALREQDYPAVDRRLQLLERIDPASARLDELRDRVAMARRHEAMLLKAEQLAAGGRTDRARAVLRDILDQDPTQSRARQRLAHLVREQYDEASLQAAEGGVSEALRRPVSIEFRDTSLRSVFEALTRMAGVNFVFDRDVRSDSRITVFLRDVSLDEAVRTILQSQSLGMQRLNDSAYMIFPNTPQKAREYVPLAAQGFYLSNIDVKQAQALLRSVVKSKDMFIDEKLNMLVVKDTPDAVRLAGQLLQSIDLPESEVMLDIEILEIASSRLQELGIRYPSQINFGLLAVGSSADDPGAAPASGGQVVTRGNWAAQVAQIASPSLVAMIKASDGSTNLLMNPRIRVRNRDKAKFQLGEKVPVFTTSFAGTGIGVGTALGSSTTYIDVGLKFEIEPVVHLEGQVAMKLQLEVSSILEQVTGPAQTTAYRIGTRQAETSLRLGDGETQVLAGLIQDNETRTADRVPGLGDLPVLGRLFSSQTSRRQKTEVILMITPRIVRTMQRPPQFERALQAGTDAMAGAAPLRLGAGARASLAPGRGGIGGAAPVASGGIALRGRQAEAEVSQPGGGEPAGAAENDANDAGTGARVILDVPTSVKAGQEFAVAVNVEAIGIRPGATVDVRYDPSVFSPTSAATTQAGVLALPLADGSAQVMLRAGPVAGRSGTIVVEAVRARAKDGSALAATPPAPVNVTVTP